jgi:hypothetical protein
MANETGMVISSMLNILRTESFISSSFQRFSYPVSPSVDYTNQGAILEATFTEPETRLCLLVPDEDLQQP